MRGVGVRDARGRGSRCAGSGFAMRGFSLGGFCLSLGAASPVSWSSEEFIDGWNDPVFAHLVASDTLILQ